MRTKSIKHKITKKTKQPPIKKQAELVTVVLLCDSPGYRMKSYGPLSLITINNVKLIDIQIMAIKEAFANFELIICLGFDSEKVCRYIRSKYPNLNIRIVENQLYHSSNSCESLRLSLNNVCNDKLIICDGNLLFTKQSLSLIDLKHSCALIEKLNCPTLEIGLNTDSTNIAHFFSFGAKNTWSEIIYLQGRNIIESLRRSIVNYDSKNRFIFEALNEIINMDYSIRCIVNDYKITKINNIKTYHKIKDTKHESFNI